ncbi:MAG: helix-turn-helix transcriptional regulator [Rhizobiaceae bacterium]|nr:helix-turn-helix transcriptional regulator [Rhizobiaceae bacterium]
MAEKNKPKAKSRKAILAQNPHSTAKAGGNLLEESIGREVRTLREQLGMTISRLAKSANMSGGMLSKIENGSTSASLSSLQALSHALHVPVTTLFKSFEKSREATFVKAGDGLEIERRGTRAGHQYMLLGHAPHGDLTVEPYLITLQDSSDVFPVFQHEGLEFIYMLEGEVAYRHGDHTYNLHPGDSLFFDANAPHGPEEMTKLPIRFLSIISYSRDTQKK